MDRYNGWTNWATWNAALWIDNDEGTYKERIRQGRRQDWNENTAEQFFFEMLPEGTPDMDPGDIKEINFEEIAQSWNEE